MKSRFQPKTIKTKVLAGVETPIEWSALAAETAKNYYLKKTSDFEEESIVQMFSRVVGAISDFGEEIGVFNASEKKENFSAQLFDLLVQQEMSFNSPVYFNCGLFQSYGLEQKGNHFHYDVSTQKIVESENIYERPQCSACFIQSLTATEQGVSNLLSSEKTIFEYGSGSGTNFSGLRKQNGFPLIENLLKFDRSAGQIRSGGVLRRAAKMVCIDVDHPEVLDFILWKSEEEKKARRIVEESPSSENSGILLGRESGDQLESAMTGQNSNNSVRVTDDFMSSIDVLSKTKKNFDVEDENINWRIWSALVISAWECGDPGLQFEGAIQRNHTCKMTGSIRASNPCSEFMFLDDTACNLASLNLLKFYSNGEFLFEKFLSSIKVTLLAQEILVGFSSYPQKEIAENSLNFRPLGLGFTNLGALLMQLGLPYDSGAARDWARFIACALQGQALLVSAEMAESFGSFAGFEANKDSFFEVRDRQKKSAEKFCSSEKFDETMNKTSFAKHFNRLQKIWTQVGRKEKFRNSQVTVIAPTGTISFLMDCDTTGIEPDYALKKSKDFVDGRRIETINRSVEPALRNLNYSNEEIQELSEELREKGHFENSPLLKKEHLPIFDTAVKPEGGQRMISFEGHLSMMAAVQPFLSGAISKTVNLPSEATIQDISDIYLRSWSLELKSVAIFRSGSKVLQPLKTECVDCG